MDAVNQQFEQLAAAWSKTYVAVESNPTAVQPYLNGATLAQVNEVVETIGKWLPSVRAPKGFAPGFRLAKGLAATALAGSITAAQALSRAEYGHFPSFIVALNQILSALHSMLVFSDKQKTRDAVAELGGKLAQALALLDTAQGELAEKTERLGAAEEALSVLQKAAEQGEDLEKKSQEAFESIAAQQAAAVEGVTAVQQAVDGSAELQEQLDALVGESMDLREGLVNQGKKLDEILQKSGKQSDLIDALLPKGASAGLASAFADRGNQMEKTKWAWAGMFLLCIVGLVVVSLTVIDQSAASSAQVWRELAHRLPLAAPLVWLGWFSAVQYGNTLRVQEDYAFKAATSKAFAGYRDHMEHMANVSLEEGNTAMTLLAAHTIEILSREPLRIFGRVHKDASPGHTVFGVLSRTKTEARVAKTSAK